MELPRPERSAGQGRGIWDQDVNEHGGEGTGFEDMFWTGFEDLSGLGTM